ncbi:MAG: hypothetical protein PWP37_1098 [Thermotogota bacterium]|nr:hypothetical protein [Thermotogota bacterium]MDK2864906.1 hypothetical protein [Thermotogota bacterium]HCZ06289.1 ferritin [Thermotogota bacterium]
MIGLDQLLNVALKIESKGYSYYSELAQRTEGEVSDVFQKLAEEERNHAERFKKIFADVSRESEGGWPSEEILGYLTTYAEVSIFPKLEEDVPQNLKDAVELALDVEKESIMFYLEVADYVKSPVVTEIVNEERKHVRTLLQLVKRQVI